MSDPKSDRLTQPQTDFLGRAFLGVACVCLTVMPPFGINNFLHGRYLMGIGAFVIVSIFAFNTWSIIRCGRYYTSLTLFGLVPAVIGFLALSLLTQGFIGIFWCYPAAIVFYFTLPERKAWSANAALLGAIIPLVLHTLPIELSSRMIVTLMMISIFSIIFVRIINQQQQQLVLQAMIDPLTHLLNRTLLSEILEEAYEQSKRSQLPMSLVAIDIDHFKDINDTFGHEQGDNVLKSISQHLLSRVRRVDKIFRLGGEEFLVLLYNTGSADALNVAEEFRTGIASLNLLRNRSVTISLGVATLARKETQQQWIRRSDDNLYKAKNKGRNQVVV